MGLFEPILSTGADAPGATGSAVGGKTFKSESTQGSDGSGMVAVATIRVTLNNSDANAFATIQIGTVAANTALTLTAQQKGTINNVPLDIDIVDALPAAGAERVFYSVVGGVARWTIFIRAGASTANQVRDALNRGIEV